MQIALAFTSEFAAQLAGSQYTRWVLDRGFTEDNMLALLCMIGEFDACASGLLKPLFEDRANLRPSHRPICALEGLRGQWSRRLKSGYCLTAN